MRGGSRFAEEEAFWLSKLKRLVLGDNQMAALASAIRSGALPPCEFIELNGNPGSATQRGAEFSVKIRKSLGSATSAAALAAKQGHAACVEALAFDANTGSVE